MSTGKKPPESTCCSHSGRSHTERGEEESTPTAPLSRRELLGSTAAFATAGLTGALASPPSGQAQDNAWGGGGQGPGKGQRIVLKGGVVLTMDSQKGDFANADVLISGSKIESIEPNLGASGYVIDCAGMIIMPGFIDSHHHNYQTIQRAVVPDGLLGNFGGEDWPQETYASVPEAIWTMGFLPAANLAGPPIWDLGRPPYDPQDCYISELVCSLAGIDAGVTTGIDTSQSSHTPQHTDALIQGLIDSGRRTLFVYSQGRATRPATSFRERSETKNTALDGCGSSGLARMISS
jgi:5-methylthioadenosine/S-adenosylhomocysteine deaminase